MKMKKVLLMVAFVIPVMMMAQTKKVSQKSTNKGVERIAFQYLEMIVTEVSEQVVSSPKISKKSKENISDETLASKYKITLNVGRLSKDHQKLLNKASMMRNPIEALSYLGSLGWELGGVSGDSYYLKRRR